MSESKENQYEEIGKEFDSKTGDFARNLIRELLDQLPKGYQDKFNRIYGSIETIEIEKMRHAYYLCKNSLNNLPEVKNE